MNREPIVRIIAFFLLAYCITWGFSAVVYYNESVKILPSSIISMLNLFTGYGPAISAMIISYIQAGTVGIKALLNRYIRWKVAIQWYAFALFSPLLLSITTVIIDVFLGGTVPTLFSAPSVPEGNPIIMLPIVFILVFFQTGFAEETGWRGFALPALQKRFSPLVASILIGIIWALWHFGPMSTQVSLGVWYIIDVIAISIIITWIFNRTNGSLLIVALFHTAINVTVWIIPTMPVVSNAQHTNSYIIHTLLLCLLAVSIIILNLKDFAKNNHLLSHS